VEFVVTSAHFLNTHAKYSDIVLPATTEWERWGTVLTGNREILMWTSQITEPLYEAKDDLWMEVEIGKRLGIDPKVIDPIPIKQRIFNQISGAMVVTDDGRHYEPLVSITASDLVELGISGKPQSGRLPILELRERGIYQVKRSPGDHLSFIAFKDFRDNPQANPLKTPSGKLHIFSQDLTDEIKLYGWTEVAPIAQYVAAVEGFEETFKDWDHRVKGDYPFQLITPHYLRRAHSVLDNIPWLRRAWPQELMMNTLDARDRGLSSGDTVKVTSRHGAVIRPVQVTPHIMPGVVALGEGAWADRDDKTGIDRAGASNSLAGSLPCGQGVQPWNTNSVQVRKYQGSLPADYTWPQRIMPREG
jgi:anaerobic dimethyl sulfoxide reductase subunit A